MDDLLHAQLRHNTWATRRVIEACRRLPDPADFTRSFDIGLGSLQATIAHVIESMNFIAANLRGDRYEKPADFEDESRSIDGLLRLLDVADRTLHDAVFEYLDEHFTRDAVRWSPNGREYPAAVVLAQAFDHGTHHRAQCVNMLRHSGVTDLPKTWPLAWASCEDE